MAKTYEAIDERIAEWVSRQHMFFVTTAPSGDDGLINCSPKGLDTFRILGPTTVEYLDLPGSGIETVAHLKDNARIVIMMSAFEGPPKILRFHGRGRVVEPREPELPTLLAQFPEQPACRSIVVVDVERIADTCGYGVPVYERKAPRPSLANWVGSQTPGELAEYLAKNNGRSLDGLPGLAPAGS